MSKKNAAKKILLGSALFLLVAGITYATGEGGSGTATTQTIETLFQSWQGTLMNVLTFIEFVCAFGGIILVVMGLFQLKSGHVQGGGGQQVQTKAGFVYMILGGALMIIATISGVIANSIDYGMDTSVTTTLNGYAVANAGESSADDS